MESTEIRIAGFGGQGVILAGMVIGRAATIYDNKHVTLTQSFGPEARGSACSVQLIVSPEPILYPYLTTPDILVAMSQEACTRFVPGLKPGRPAALRTGPDQARASLRPEVQDLRHPGHALGRRTGTQAGPQHGHGGIRHGHDFPHHRPRPSASP